MEAHVLAVPFPAQGHLNPCMRFCHMLASHGVLVTFVNVDFVQSRLEEQEEEEAEDVSADEVGAAVPKKIRRVHIPIQGMDLSNDFRVSFQSALEAQITIAPHLEGLIGSLTQPPVTCILSDISMTVPTQSVADKLNLPRIVLVTSNASQILLHHYVIQGERISFTRVMDALNARRANRRQIVCDGLIGLPTLYNDDLPRYKHVVDDTLYVWKHQVSVFEESFNRACAIAVNSSEELEAPVFTALSKQLSLPVYGVGPFVEPLHKDSSTSLWKADEACLMWLDQQPPLSVLYIAFGSMTRLSKPQFEEIVAGLFSSQQRFLWVLRRDLVEDNEYSSTIVSDVLSGSHGKGYVVDWAPQLQVLSHPTVSGFLTHCGWNSTVEAMAHGVPMLCWPYMADQLLNAKYIVEEWKVGLRFEAREEGACLVERGEVERVIKALMDGEEGRALRKNAMRLKEAVARSWQPRGTCHVNIQALIRSFI